MGSRLKRQEAPPQPFPFPPPRPPPRVMADEPVDDTNTTQIAYSRGWFTAGRPEEYNSTIHGTLSGRATASFSFSGKSTRSSCISPNFQHCSQILMSRHSSLGIWHSTRGVQQFATRLAICPRWCFPCHLQRTSNGRSIVQTALF